MSYYTIFLIINIITFCGFIYMFFQYKNLKIEIELNARERAALEFTTDEEGERVSYDLECTSCGRVIACAGSDEVAIVKRIYHYCPCCGAELDTGSLPECSTCIHEETDLTKEPCKSCNDYSKYEKR